jgi:hypothetical protein
LIRFLKSAGSWKWKVFIFLVFLGSLTGLRIKDAQAEVIYEDFSATATLDGNILLEWWTDSETNNRAFYVQRSINATANFSRLPNSYTLTESESGEGGYYYFYEDNTVLPAQTYFYRIEAIDAQGNSSLYGPISAIVSESTPTSTRTGSVVPQPTVLTATPTQPNSTATVAAAFTQSVLSLTQSATVFRTGVITAGLTTTSSPGVTSTPTPSKTFEPLPTIELLFPDTSTPIIQVQAALSTPLPDQSTPDMIATHQLSIRRLPDRLLLLMGVVGVLWLCLGVFLVFMVRRLEQ